MATNPLPPGVRECRHCHTSEDPVSNQLDWQCTDREACARRVAANERAKHETGPWAGNYADACHCAMAAIWGATGTMPIGHVWYWSDVDHTTGYLAHQPASWTVKADLAEMLHEEWPHCFNDGFQDAVAAAVVEHLGDLLDRHPASTITAMRPREDK